MISTKTRHIAQSNRFAYTPTPPHHFDDALTQLSATRKRILRLREKVDIALQKAGIQNNIDKIQESLAVLSDDNGHAVLPYPISPIDLVLIWGAPQANLIKKISFSGIDINFHPDDFEISAKRFIDFFETECPDGLLKTRDLSEKIEKILGRKIDSLTNFKDSCLYQFIFDTTTATPLDNFTAQCLHHDFGYFPCAHFDGDRDTYGLVYDFYKRSFYTSIYMYSDVDAVYHSPLAALIDKLTDDSRYNTPCDEEFDLSDLSDAKLIRLFSRRERKMSGHNYYVDISDYISRLEKYTIAHFISAYLDANPTARRTIPQRERRRYNTGFFVPVAEEDKLREQYQGHYLFNRIFPITPIPLEKFGGSNHDDIDRFVVFVYELAYRSNGFNLPQSISDLNKILGPCANQNLAWSYCCNNLYAIAANMEKTGASLQDHVLKEINNTINELHSFALKMALGGNDGYAFIAATLLWNSHAGKNYRKLVLELLESLQNPTCPEFIKTMVKLPHLPDKYDR